MKDALRIFAQMAKISISSAFAYRVNFFFNISIGILSNLLAPLVTILIYNAGASFPEWTFYEALLIQSVFMLTIGFCSPLFYGMVWVTMGHIRDGSYDILMIKPGSIIVLSIANSFEPENIGVFLGGLGMFIYALLNLPPTSFINWFQFLLFFISAVALNLGFVLIMSATCFKWVGNSRIFEMYDSLTAFGRYPGTIFSKILMFITSSVVPVAVLGFIPASALLGRSNLSMLAAIIPCFLFTIFGIFIFKHMIYKYQSAGG